MMAKTTRMMRISELAVRRGSGKDIEEITKIEDRAFGSHAYDYPELKFMLETANSITMVAVLDDGMVGYASVYLRKKSKTSHLESIAVDPDFQGRGIGRALLSEAERISVEMGCTSMVLETFERNATALSLYEHSGYSRVEVVEDYYHIPFDGSRNAIRFLKTLK